MITQYLQIHVARSGIQAKVEVVQRDSGRDLKCQIMDMTIPEGSTARIYAKKPSGLEIYNDCTVSGNAVLVELTTQLLAEIGTVPAQIELTLGEDTVTSFEFLLVVKRSLVKGSAIESKDEFTALEKALNDAHAAAYQAVSEYIEANGLEVGVSDEQIQTAVDKYLAENPVGTGKVYMRVSEGYIQFSSDNSDNESWENVIETAELKGEKGDDGGHYTPTVDDDGNLSWTGNKAEMEEVPGTNIKGPAGDDGVGIDGIIFDENEDKSGLILTIKLTTGQELPVEIKYGKDGGYYIPFLDSSGNLTWLGSKDGMEEVDSGNIKGPQGNNGPQGPQGKQGPAGADGHTPVKGEDYYTEEDKQEMVDAVLEALPDDEFVKTAAQELTEEQKTQARSNIGAASASEVSKLSEEIVNQKVSLDEYASLTLGKHTDGLIYIFKNGSPIGNGIEMTGEVVEGDVWGYVDENNVVTLYSNNLTEGNTYTFKFNMEDGTTIDIGTAELDNNVYYSVTNNLTNCTNSNSTLSIAEGESYSATITANDGYTLSSVVVTMGGTDVSSAAVSDGTISIAEVTGDIVITAVAEETTVEIINQIPLSINSDGTLFNNGQGWETGYRLSSSTGAVSANSGTEVTGFIPVAYGDVLYSRDITADKTNSKHTFACYDSSFTRIAGGLTGYLFDAPNGEVASCTLDSTLVSDITTSITYIRISAGVIDENSVITVNQVLTEDTVVE